MVGKDAVDLLFDVIEREDGDPEKGGDPEKVDIVLRVWLQPGAGRTAVVGRHGDALKVKVGAPPADGRANAACLTFIAQTLGVPAAQVELSGGAASRSKRIRVHGLAVADLRRALELALGNAASGPGVRPHAR